MVKILVVSSKGGTGKSMLSAALRDALGDAQVVDLDPQKTITISAREGGRPMPVDPSMATAKYIIYDTPPYHDEGIRGMLSSSDHILIPVKSGLSDLIAAKSIYDDLTNTNNLEKAFFVFNEVRKPINNTHKEIVQIFKDNYPGLKVANTQLSSLIGFNRVLAEELSGKALDQMKNIIKEIGF